ncbi:peptidoglycan-binding protein [Streptomyces gilvifuscus]|uniref:Peptidoglycan-binding protein n=1 Tax=Streptomyces gilvifuscus TaxID=1550617 RepID=A0ABT5FLP8_9ACTN|nr:peptidoglycan-binding protein [Streptomyces gilvifuscus]MDC2953402.1 peptidoglycan-binding protein [Streptomyces gilvifuscus]
MTWDRSATKAKPIDLVPYANLRSYFSGGGKAVAPHVLWDPFTGRCGQFVPANSRSKSVVDLAGGTRTNRAGSVVIQIEALFFPWCRVDGKVYESLDDTPGKGWDELHAWVKSWGVPNVWPMGKPNGFTGHRDEHIWETRAGWYGHNQVPENSHTDPGAWFAFPASKKPSTGSSGTKQYEPFPGASWFSMSRTSPIVGRMHDRLVAVGCNRYKSSSNKNTIGSGDVASYEAWQRKLKYTGSAATWPPGKTSWDLLKVPKS